MTIRLVTKVRSQNAELKLQDNVKLLLSSICAGDDASVHLALNYSKSVFARHPQTFASTAHLAVIHNHPSVLKLILKQTFAKSLINARDRVRIFFFRGSETIFSRESRKSSFKVKQQDEASKDSMNFLAQLRVVCARRI